jgi:hypothetical protein
MFVNTQMGGLDLGFPDVCLTPAPPGPPVPVPYPNIANGMMAIPNCPKVLLMGMPMHNLDTIIPMTNGDEAGVGTGVASGTVMGKSRHILGAFTARIEGMPMTRLTSLSNQNGTNCVGMRGVPSQTLSMVLAP